MDRVLFFRELGFSEYEAKVLAALVKLESATAKEINLASRVPQNKLYSILEGFEKRGILSTLPVEPKKFKLMNIETFVSKKLKEKEDNLKELKKKSKQIKEIGDKEEQFTFTLIKGQQAIMDRLAEANRNVKKEILGVQRNWKYWAEGIRAMKDAVKKGVDVKLIGIVNDDNKSRVVEWKKIGCKIKKYNNKFGEFPLRFSIFDNKWARITIGKPEIQNPDDYLTIWTDSKAMIAMLRNQFMQMWKESENL
jgi:sugar-specific transcriptional regulator TrmB